MKKEIKMKKIFLLLMAMCILSVGYATPQGVSFTESLQDQRVDKGIVFDATIIKTDLAAAISYNYVIDPLFDLVIDLETGAETAISMVVYEDPTTAGGTTQTAYNEDRNSAKTATALATLTSAPVTVSVQGTAIYSKIAQDGNINKRLVLDADSDYLVQITNRATTTGDISVGLSFFQNALRIK